MKLMGLLIVGSVLPLQLWASDFSLPRNNCQTDLSHPISQVDYAQMARAAGIRYLMLRINPSEFMELVQTKSLKLKSQALVPLRDAHGGTKWAHQLMSDNDSIGMGWRTKLASDWKIGFIFSVDILNQIPFNIQFGKFGYGSIEFSTSDQSAEEFALALGNLTKEPYPESFNVHNSYFIHPEIELPLAQAELIWIPGPLMTELAGGQAFPGSKSPLLPEVGVAFQQQIALEVNGIRDWSRVPKGWRQVRPDYPWINLPPPIQDDLLWLDPQSRLGTWFNVVPDWSLVERAIADAPEISRTRSLTDR